MLVEGPPGHHVAFESTISGCRKACRSLVISTSEMGVALSPSRAGKACHRAPLSRARFSLRPAGAFPPSRICVARRLAVVGQVGKFVGKCLRDRPKVMEILHAAVRDTGRDDHFRPPGYDGFRRVSEQDWLGRIKEGRVLDTDCFGRDYFPKSGRSPEAATGEMAV